MNSRVQTKCTKSIDMQFHWLHDQSIILKQFRFFLCMGMFNFADYWIKRHQAAHHKNIRREFLTLFNMLIKRATATHAPVHGCVRLLVYISINICSRA